jgi:DNA-directed RNA polymerase specialized sigma24 family protein
VRRAKASAPRRWLAGAEQIEPELIDLAFGPHLRVVHGEEAEKLRIVWMLFLQHYAAAFDSLSPRDRRALELVEVDELSYAETGQRLGVGPSNMKMIMLRARRRLHTRMRASMCMGHAAAVRSARKTA